MTADDFEEGGKFAKLSCNENGLTNFGFKQVMDSLPASDVDQILERMGYDSAFYSNKSRIFVCTLHAKKPLKISIKNAIGTNIYFTAMNMLISKVIEEKGTGRGRQDDNALVFGYVP